MDNSIEKIKNSILAGDMKNAPTFVKDAITKGVSADVILNDGLISAMSKAGKLFEDGEYFVPELLVTAQAMKNGLDELKPQLVKSNVKPAGKVVIGTIQGDIHEIGKSLVSMMLEGAGFEVYDLGTDVSPENFVKTVEETGADILAMSALLTTTMTNMAETIKTVENHGLRKNLKIIIGGAPVSNKFAEEIGADGYADDANQAVRLSLSLMKKQS